MSEIDILLSSTGNFSLETLHTLTTRWLGGLEGMKVHYVILGRLDLGVIVHIYFVDVTTYTIDSSAATSQYTDSSSLVGQATIPHCLFDSRVDGCCIRSGSR